MGDGQKFRTSLISLSDYGQSNRSYLANLPILGLEGVLVSGGGPRRSRGGAGVGVPEELDDVADALLDDGVELVAHRVDQLDVGEHVLEAVGEPQVEVEDVVHRLQVDEVEDGVGRGEGPAHLVAQPVEGDQLAAAELPRDLEEHGADERHPRVDGGAAERVPGGRYILNLYHSRINLVPYLTLRGILMCSTMSARNLNSFNWQSE